MITGRHNGRNLSISLLKNKAGLRQKHFVKLDTFTRYLYLFLGEQMCGRFVQKSERKIIADEFYVGEFFDDVVISYNVAPGQKAGVILRGPGTNTYHQFKWGLVPSWADDPSIGNRMINARAETLREKPSFRKAFLKSRCIIPVDGFYEWKKTGSHKRPFYIFRKDKKPFGLGGLWEQWQAPDGSILKTFTIVTVDANQLLEELHSRMPLIISEKHLDIWLGSENPGDVFNLIKPASEDLLDFYEVSTLVNSPANNNPFCIEPVSL